VTTRTLITCVGDVAVTRRCGWCPACRRGVVGFDAWAGLGRDSLTPGGRRMAVLAGSRMSFDEAAAHLGELCGIRVSDQTIRRACDASGALAQAYMEGAAAAGPLREAAGPRECSTDGAKVNTREGWREGRAVVACRREAGVPAGVRGWKDRPLPKPSPRLAWAGIADSRAVGERMGALAERLGWARGEGVSVVADGAAWVWTQARARLPLHEGVLDVWHLLEHLHAAGRVLHGEGEAARRWAELQRALLFRHGATRYLRSRLLPQAKKAARDTPGGPAARALRSLLLYLWPHRGRMAYRDRLRRGLPIGSGQIEGVCKNTLNRRLRLNNARWRPERADRMAALCCLHYSHQWERFWAAAA